ncbi:uncharacterized protein [Rutidosis leptorrhynchoides]|uniref:uncharacterized protein n=1 Tax=Rutidosis leptorrhynchoides TaxID=125765 RepID=UPI003A9980EA
MGSSTSSLSLRILLISTSVLSIAMAINFCFPTILDFALNDIPSIWSVIISWLKPPYLYVVINGIIITIAASSRFHHHYHNDHQSQPLVHETTSYQPPDLVPSELPHVSIEPSFDDSLEVHEDVGFEREQQDEYPIIDVDTVHVSDPVDVPTQFEDKFEVSASTSTWDPPQRLISPPAELIHSELVSLVAEKPLVRSRFANQRRTTKINSEGVKSLRVAKPKKHETLESTWKAITDGRHMPLNRHLRKSDTFENHQSPSSDVDSGESTSAVVDYNVMDKSETFNDRTDYDDRNQRSKLSKNSSFGKLRKEGSVSHDELNRRVEAFIKKSYEEMRLQREESLKRYMDMINRGAE